MKFIVLPFYPRDILNSNFVAKRPASKFEMGVWLRPQQGALMGPFIFWLIRLFIYNFLGNPAIQLQFLDKRSERLVFFPLQQFEICQRYVSVRNRAWRLWLQRIWRGIELPTISHASVFPSRNFTWHESNRSVFIPRVISLVWSNCCVPWHVGKEGT